MDVSTYLRGLLEDRGWAPSELAHRAGVSRQYVNSLINGDRASMRLDKAKAIARALGVTLDDMADALFGADE